MFEIFMLYEINATTWFYLSALMIIGIFFKFRRFWSVRNFDIWMLLALGPGLLLVAHNFYVGYVVLFTLLFMGIIRMLCDPLMKQRPMHEVNLSSCGLIFSCAALLCFQTMGLVLTQTRDEVSPQNASLEQLMMYHLNERILKVDLGLDDEGKLLTNSAESLPSAGLGSEIQRAENSPGSTLGGVNPVLENAAGGTSGAASGTASGETHDAKAEGTAGGASALEKASFANSSQEKMDKMLLVHGPGMPFFTNLADFPRQWRYERMRQKKLKELWMEKNGAVENVLDESGHELETLDGNQHEDFLSDYPSEAKGLAEGQVQTIQFSKFPFFPVRQIRSTIILATLAQIAIVAGIILIGWRHFENFNTGVAAATLYLLLPYVSQMPSRLDHLVPGALIVWAVFLWRLPTFSGILLGIAAALSYYPIFLLPVWCSFYWKRGICRFATASVGIFLLSFAFVIPASGGWGPFIEQSGDIFGCVGLFSRSAAGFWDIEGHSVFYRIPVVVLYLLMVLFLTFWPPQKNLGILLSSSAILMLGAQFCHPFQGGTYMAWFLPLMILVILRPNLEDRTAMRAIGRTRRRGHAAWRADS